MGVSMQEVTSELDKSCVINLDKCIERIEPPIIFRGGNAIVYKGIHRPEGTMVALKMEKFPDDESPKRILYEALVWSKLSHKNIAPLCGFTITFDGSVSLVSPWQDRGNAHDYVQNSDVDPRPLLLGIARGVKYLHCHDSGPIAHGDLKGQNILIADHGRPLLTDFGSSSLPESSGTMILRPRGGGTLMWMAPEQLGDEIASVQSDVWAFGMTALELFTRKVPFQGVSTIPGLMARIVRCPPSRPVGESTYDRLTDAWWSICTRCWQQDPALRPSMSDIFAEIKRDLAMEPTSRSHSIGHIDDGQIYRPIVTTSSYSFHPDPVQHVACSQGVNVLLGHPMNKESSTSEYEHSVMDRHRFTGRGSIAVSNHCISGSDIAAVSRGTFDPYHYHTSPAIPSIRAEDDLKTTSMFTSPEGPASTSSQSVWHTTPDMVASIPRSTRYFINPIKLAPEDIESQHLLSAHTTGTESESHSFKYGGLYFLLTALVLALGYFAQGYHAMRSLQDIITGIIAIITWSIQ